MSLLGELLWKTISAERYTELETGEVDSIELVEKHRFKDTLRIVQAYPEEEEEESEPEDHNEKFWPLPGDVECPECGEDTYLMSNEYEEDDEGIWKATIHCGLGPVDGEMTGCGNTWTWTREESYE